MNKRVGDFVEVNGALGVVVSLTKEQSFIPPGYVGVWFGPNLTEPKPVDSRGHELPLVHILPEDSCISVVRLEDD